MLTSCLRAFRGQKGLAKGNAAAHMSSARGRARSIVVLFTVATVLPAACAGPISTWTDPAPVVMVNFPALTAALEDESHACRATLDADRDRLQSDAQDTDMFGSVAPLAKSLRAHATAGLGHLYASCSNYLVTHNYDFYYRMARLWAGAQLGSDPYDDGRWLSDALTTCTLAQSDVASNANCNVNLMRVNGWRKRVSGD